MNWTVKALCVGHFPSRPKASITYMHNWNESIDLAVYMFLVENGSTSIIVDTGTLHEDAVRALHPHKLVQSEAYYPSNRLREAGIDPYDVSTVINTHLHWDHCSNNALFPRADFIVQQRELAYATNPLPIHRTAYEKKRGIVPPWVSVWDRIQTVDGDVSLMDGIKIISLPGHSPGSQGLLVDTAGGPVLIAGDCVDTYENWNGSESVPHIPSAGHTNLFEYWSSFEKIENLKCEVIPSHDPLIEGKTWG